MKVYVCLFTCATTRAVHLELVTDMTASAFLRAFRRFAGRRSYPRLIISDNGSNFRASEVFLRQYFELSEVQQFFEKRRCEWKFIPPRSPWQGRFYERMIGVVKKCLRKVLHHKRVTIDELRTLLVEIEARVNNLPLTYMSETVNEPEPLTPNHLLQGSLIEPIPTCVRMDQIKDPDYLRKSENNLKEVRTRFSQISKLLKQWNVTWHKDYLTSLREQHYAGSSNVTSSKLKIGDIVLIEGDMPRAEWPLGKIEAIMPDKTGTLRLVKVLCKGNVSLRTIDKLIPLEISVDSTEESTNFPERLGKGNLRQAAQTARARWNEQLDQTLHDL